MTNQQLTSVYPIGYQPRGIMPLNNNQYGQQVSNQYYQNSPYNGIQNGQPSTPPSTGVIWVQGEAGAKAYQVTTPNLVVPLFDTENQTIYLKYLDQQGRPQYEILDYVNRNAPSPQPPTQEVAVIETGNFVTQEQFADFSNQMTQQFAELQKKLNDFKARVGNNKNTAKKENKS